MKILFLSLCVVCVSAFPRADDRITLPSPNDGNNGWLPSWQIQCSDFTNCGSCVLTRGCAWDENAGWRGACKSDNECDYNEKPVFEQSYAAAHTSVSVCINNYANCFYQRSDRQVERNPSRGRGCSTHDQCGRGQYCFSCEKCRNSFPGQSMCGLCDYDFSASGDCGPRSACQWSGDSVNGFCPPRWG